MLLNLQMPRIGEEMIDGTIHRVLASPGGRVEVGTPLVEVMVDLSAASEQNCAPVSFFRLVAAESGWVRSMEIVPGARKAVGSTIAVVSTGPDDPLEGEARRPIRVSVGCILE